MNRLIALTLLCAGFSTGLACSAEHTKDSTEQVKKAVAEKKAVLIDVREQKEWDDGHLKDAALLPLSKLKEGIKADELAKIAPKGTIVYLHCKAGGRCLQAADLLSKYGIEARPLADGYETLIQAGFEKAK